jgi:hypothetical protein
MQERYNEGFANAAQGFFASHGASERPPFILKKTERSKANENENEKKGI